ncbi:hypothetical protein C8Q79DRAFT_1007468 [Trametes meyenii]|nr:hypothetical protein C8Q79DRAFT_1007468 [Trametes meyenii]
MPPIASASVPPPPPSSFVSPVWLAEHDPLYVIASSTFFFSLLLFSLVLQGPRCLGRLFLRVGAYVSKLNSSHLSTRGPPTHLPRPSKQHNSSIVPRSTAKCLSGIASLRSPDRDIGDLKFDDPTRTVISPRQVFLSSRTISDDSASNCSPFTRLLTSPVPSQGNLPVSTRTQAPSTDGGMNG